MLIGRRNHIRATKVNKNHSVPFILIAESVNAQALLPAGTVDLQVTQPLQPRRDAPLFGADITTHSLNVLHVQPPFHKTIITRQFTFGHSWT